MSDDSLAKDLDKFVDDIRHQRAALQDLKNIGVDTGDYQQPTDEQIAAMSLSQRESLLDDLRARAGEAANRAIDEGRVSGFRQVPELDDQGNPILDELGNPKMVQQPTYGTENVAHWRDQFGNPITNPDLRAPAGKVEVHTIDPDYRDIVQAGIRGKNAALDPRGYGSDPEYQEFAKRIGARYRDEPGFREFVERGGVRDVDANSNQIDPAASPQERALIRRMAGLEQPGDEALIRQAVTDSNRPANQIELDDATKGLLEKRAQEVRGPAPAEPRQPPPDESPTRIGPQDQPPPAAPPAAEPKAQVPPEAPPAAAPESPAKGNAGGGERDLSFLRDPNAMDDGIRHQRSVLEELQRLGVKTGDQSPPTDEQIARMSSEQKDEVFRDLQDQARQATNRAIEEGKVSGDQQVPELDSRGNPKVGETGEPILTNEPAHGTESIAHFRDQFGEPLKNPDLNAPAGTVEVNKLDPNYRDVVEAGVRGKNAALDPHGYGSDRDYQEFAQRVGDRYRNEPGFREFVEQGMVRDLDKGSNQLDAAASPQERALIRRMAGLEQPGDDGLIRSMVAESRRPGSQIELDDSTRSVLERRAQSIRDPRGTVRLSPPDLPAPSDSTVVLPPPDLPGEVLPEPPEAGPSEVPKPPAPKAPAGPEDAAPLGPPAEGRPAETPPEGRPAEPVEGAGQARPGEGARPSEPGDVAPPSEGPRGAGPREQITEGPRPEPQGRPPRELTLEGEDSPVEGDPRGGRGVETGSRPSRPPAPSEESQGPPAPEPEAGRSLDAEGAAREYLERSGFKDVSVTTREGGGLRLEATEPGGTRIEINVAGTEGQLTLNSKGLRSAIESGVEGVSDPAGVSGALQTAMNLVLIRDTILKVIELSDPETTFRAMEAIANAYDAIGKAGQQGLSPDTAATELIQAYDQLVGLLGPITGLDALSGWIIYAGRLEAATSAGKIAARARPSQLRAIAALIRRWVATARKQAGTRRAAEPEGPEPPPKPSWWHPFDRFFWWVLYGNYKAPPERTATGVSQPGATPPPPPTPQPPPETPPDEERHAERIATGVGAGAVAGAIFGGGVGAPPAGPTAPGEAPAPPQPAPGAPAPTPTGSGTPATPEELEQRLAVVQEAIARFVAGLGGDIVALQIEQHRLIERLMLARARQSGQSPPTPPDWREVPQFSDGRRPAPTPTGGGGAPPTPPAPPPPPEPPKPPTIPPPYTPTREPTGGEVAFTVGAIGLGLVLGGIVAWLWTSEPSQKALAVGVSSAGPVAVAPPSHVKVGGRVPLDGTYVIDDMKCYDAGIGTEWDTAGSVGGVRISTALLQSDAKIGGTGRPYLFVDLSPAVGRQDPNKVWANTQSGLTWGPDNHIQINAPLYEGPFGQFGPSIGTIQLSGTCGGGPAIAPPPAVMAARVTDPHLGVRVPVPGPDPLPIGGGLALVAGGLVVARVVRKCPPYPCDPLDAEVARLEKLVAEDIVIWNEAFARWTAAVDRLAALQTYLAALKAYREQLVNYAVQLEEYIKQLTKAIQGDMETLATFQGLPIQDIALGRPPVNDAQRVAAGAGSRSVAGIETASLAAVGDPARGWGLAPHPVHHWIKVAPGLYARNKEAAEVARAAAGVSIPGTYVHMLLTTFLLGMAMILQDRNTEKLGKAQVEIDDLEGNQIPAAQAEKDAAFANFIKADQNLQADRDALKQAKEAAKQCQEEWEAECKRISEGQ